ncbi:FAD-binding protein [Wenjunlia vitaminophila]|uniref:FAD-binding protein n=1 Tax=Wenjunlia vitaminophila TaxID=76728 RepID=A0A0T6LP30_WENVI|nr:FAD/NAD(P)-binding protein [Wenjunlia vitaminophila]KRV47781.1 FAD-binding protein [Wenjunlia vitaminophila]
MTHEHLVVCVVGAGPRGLSVLERLCANARELAPDTRIDVHLIDAHPPGPGRVWRRSQSRHLLMNTVAGQISLFTDDSVDLRGPLEPGPSLHEWARLLTFSTPDEGFDAETLDEARRLGPDTYPTRGFYGTYLEWVYQRVVRTAPSRVTITTHRTRAVAVDDLPPAEGEPPRQTVLLENGVRLSHIDALVLANGHLPALPTTTQRDLRSFAGEHDLTYLRPVNPADAELARVRPGEPVLLRGLGLNFFDYMALFTVGRGGSFQRVGGRLVYRSSGQEPRMFAGSRRGIPYQARGENQKGATGRHEPLLLTPERIAELRADSERAGGIDFRTDVWPLIAKEVQTVYYRTLITRRVCVCEARRFQDRYLECPWGDPAEDRVLDAFGIPEKERWDWELIAHPDRDRDFSDPDDFQNWLGEYLRADLVEARAGNVEGPLKAALDVMRDLRNEIRLLVDHGGLFGESHRNDLDDWYTPLNAFLSIGPPASRIEEMIALMEAGVLRVIGPGMRVDTDPDGWFTAESPRVPGSRVRATTLIEAMLPPITLRRTADPLLRHLIVTGQATTYRIRTRTGGWFETDGLAITRRPFRVVDAQGRPHPRRFAFGVPTEAVHWVTAAGIRPGVNSVTLTDSDAIARAVLTCLDDRPCGADATDH